MAAKGGKGRVQLNIWVDAQFARWLRREAEREGRLVGRQLIHLVKRGYAGATPWADGPDVSK